MPSAAIVMHQTGAPAEVLTLENGPSPSPEPSELLLDMLYAPINPADLNFVEGVYGKKAELPCTPGGEGIGRVHACGSKVEGFAEGDLVLPLGWFGTWREQLCIPANAALHIPEHMDPAQASMLKVNPMTAWRMLRDFGELKSSDWVAFNAANSGVGLALIGIAKALGIRTAAIARSEEAQERCRAAGADLVVPDSRRGLVDLKRIIPEKVLPRVAFNAVGGDSATRLMSLLAPGGELVTYGAMAKEPVHVGAGLLIFKDIRLRGFWVSRWMEMTDPETVRHEYRALIDTIPDLHTPIDATFPLSDIKTAVTRAAEGGRSGKVLLKLN